MESTCINQLQIEAEKQRRNVEMNRRNWTFLACFFGPRLGFALAVSYYLGGAAIIGGVVFVAILYLCG